MCVDDGYNPNFLVTLEQLVNAVEKLDYGIPPSKS